MNPSRSMGKKKANKPTQKHIEKVLENFPE